MLSLGTYFSVLSAIVNRDRESAVGHWQFFCLSAIDSILSYRNDRIRLPLFCFKIYGISVWYF